MAARMSAIGGLSGLVILRPSSSPFDPIRTSGAIPTRNVNSHVVSLLRLDVGRADHLGPLLGFVSDEFPKLYGREREPVATQIAKPRLDLRVGEAGVDLLIELVDDLDRRGLRGTDAEPSARLVARHELTNGRDVRQYVRARRGSNGER